MTDDSYVVTRPYETSNIGSNLASLAGALWLAARLERRLLVDWRGMSQIRNASLNYFTEFFAAPSELLGVPVSYAPVPDLDYGQDAPETAWLSPHEASETGSGSARRDERFLVLQTYHGPDRIMPPGEPARFAALRAFYRALRPIPEILWEVDRWWAGQLDGRLVVGVNVRTGNGQYFGKQGPYAGRVDVSIFENRKRFLATLHRAVRRCTARFPRPLRSDIGVFCATDSAPMRDLLSELPNATSRRVIFPPPGQGDMYAFDSSEYSDRDSITDTLVDMFLLARVDALAYNSSLFNQYARVLSGNFGGNLVHIESLYARHRLRYVIRAVKRRLS